jgi:hypothetical protein
MSNADAEGQEVGQRIDGRVGGTGGRTGSRDLPGITGAGGGEGSLRAIEGEGPGGIRIVKHVQAGAAVFTSETELVGAHGVSEGLIDMARGVDASEGGVNRVESNPAMLILGEPKSEGLVTPVFNPIAGILKPWLASPNACLK